MAAAAVDAPERPVPFFAARTGALPSDGAATVGGVPLPPGSRCLRHWATDEPVPDAPAVASRLAAAFPRTGLWPVLWDMSLDDPDAYANATGDPRVADRLDPEAVLRRAWAAYVSDDRFPGLAPASPRPHDGAVAGDPFGPVARSEPDREWFLLLVPVNRPADVVAVLALWMTEVMSDHALTAVLRSWEERFGAVLTTLGPGTMGVAVDAPPRTDDQAARPAAEQIAFAPEDDLGFEPAVLARMLRTDEPESASRRRRFWTFAWPD